MTYIDGLNALVELGGLVFTKLFHCQLSISGKNMLYHTALAVQLLG